MWLLRWVTDLRDSLLLAEAASAAAGGPVSAEGGAGPAAQLDVPARTAAGLEIAATLEANRKLAVINGMGDHNRAQVRWQTGSRYAFVVVCVRSQALVAESSLPLVGSHGLPDPAIAWGTSSPDVISHRSQ